MADDQSRILQGVEIAFFVSRIELTGVALMGDIGEICGGLRLDDGLIGGQSSVL